MAKTAGGLPQILPRVVKQLFPALVLWFFQGQVDKQNLQVYLDECVLF
jgi:hypothetical protein